MKVIYTSLLLLFCIVASLNIAMGQSQITGTITDSYNEPLPGASVIEKGTVNGVTTDFSGKYTLTTASDATLVVSFVGYETAEISVVGKSVIDVTLQSKELEEVIVVGSRTAPRSSTDTPLPVDVVPARELTATGQITFDKALQYKIPSFNTVQTPVNDATALLDPYEIRNMGPSRTLILINGKRKNLSSLLYVQTAPGRGETGADISAIPTDAIKRVEILRDGASAQYGSDAIAGVMNIVLKDDARYGSATLRTGITGAGDGTMIGISVNNGTSIGNGKGFINYTVDLSKVSLANRPGKVSARGEWVDFVGYTDPDDPTNYLKEDPVDSVFKLNGVDISDLTDEERAAELERYKVEDAYTDRFNEIDSGNNATRLPVEEFLARRPDAGNINGSPETTAAKFLVNGGIDLSSNAQLYFNAAYVYKKVNSFANYRTPYWRTLNAYPYLNKFFPNSDGEGGYDGYLPTFDGDLSDYNGTVGFKANRNNWNYDLSLTVGGNRQTYRVRDSHNRSDNVFSPTVWVDTNGDSIVDAGEINPGFTVYRENSPISFDPGGTQFSHIVGNIDINKALSDRVSIGFGAEFRSETFEVIAGELASYDGIGADSFAGNRPENSGLFNRYNFGGYFDVAWDIVDNVLLNGTVRAENYSDFGDAFVWKLSSRYKFLDDKMTIRASVSTGFRAPTLHQIYTQKSQYSFVPGEGIKVNGVVNNVSPQARLLGLPSLKPESSTNITVGVGGKFFKQLSFTIDYYNIAVKDRILLSTEIGRTEKGGTDLDRVLVENNLYDLSFFVNGIDTRTSGLDVVVSYRNIKIGRRGFLGFNLSGNYTLQNEREGAIKNPPIVESANQSVANATQEAVFFTSRPRTKWILGVRYEMGKFDVSLNNTLFGKSTFKQDGLDKDLRTEFIPKVVTDIGVSFAATEKLTVALNINNLFSILPEWKFVAENAAGQAILDDESTTAGLTPKEHQSNLITFNQRYSQMTYDGSHFSQLGMLFNLSVNYQF